MSRLIAHVKSCLFCKIYTLLMALWIILLVLVKTAGAAENYKKLYRQCQAETNQVLWTNAECLVRCPDRITIQLANPDPTKKQEPGRSWQQKYEDCQAVKELVREITGVCAPLCSAGGM